MYVILTDSSTIPQFNFALERERERGREREREREREIQRERGGAYELLNAWFLRRRPLPYPLS